MKAFFQFVLQSISAFSAMVITWLITFIGFELTFLLSNLIALAGGAIVFLTVKGIADYRFVRQNGLTRREYRYIEKNLKEAKEKISRLQRSLMSVRSIDQAKHNLELIRTVRKIYSNTKKEPKRFYKAEGFYYDRLDSLVELTEKFAYLSSQPAKSKEISDSLRDTRTTIQSLGESVKKDLYIMLDDDVDTLNFELDVAKNSMERMKKKDRRILK
ncbi:5-bromo-4-chloroindolyl phosphate hydrolysis family protein [Oceanobacillus halophilus]|uniref:Protein xpaC n=1 Tax=Oceanobacillus halophilus TaxID=930130 RepID=A0A495A986_9BACI|nr:5-bromo-4-chloroindolyl phosphate hydrolysis family protein [Oceanobacillus halophilus]RKQ35825.1 protein xpaC [Oceanobacillus halophilus]